MSDETKKPPYDLWLQYQAAAIDHCLKLGGVVLKPAQKTVGFEQHPVAPERPAPEAPPWK